MATCEGTATPLPVRAYLYREFGLKAYEVKKFFLVFIDNQKLHFFKSMC
jgi:hypothetical protein